MPMGPSLLAEALKIFLAPALPYLLSLGGKAAEEAAKVAGKTGVTKVWERLWPKVEAKEAAKEAAEDLAAAPENPRAGDVFQWQLEKLLAADEDLAEELRGLLAQAGVVVVQKQSGSGGQAQGSEPVVSGERGVSARDARGASIFTGDHVHVVQGPESAARSESVRDAYLHHLFTHLRKLALSGVDPELANDPKAQMDLDAVYTALLTGSEIAPERDPAIDALRRQETPRRQLSALEQLDRHDRLVLLGDPGSGKSTFVSFVALCLAGELLGREDANLALLTSPLPDDDGDAQDEPQPWGHGAILPVRVVLRDFAAAGLPTKGTKVGARHLLDFVRGELERSSLGAFAKHLEAELRDDGGLLLLDGLDEVPEAEDRRVQLRDLVRDFAGAFPRCRILVTSRIYAYQNQEWNLGENFQEASLAPFSPGQIRLFIGRWYEEVAPRRGLTPDDARGKATLLEHAIVSNERLLALAERPLLLTLMASLHAWRGGTLPEKRESLYAAAVELLLAHWERQRVVQGADGQAVVIQRSLSEWLKVSQDRLRKALDALAFQAHAEQATGEGTADVSEGDLLAALARVSSTVEANPSLLVEFLRDRAGLLLPRGVGVYTFPHRTFQEYLAARHLTVDDFPAKLVGLARENPERWREALLLAGAKAGAGTPSSVWSLARELSPLDPGDEAAEPADHWGALLAGQVLAESADLEEVSRAQAQDLERLRENLVSAMEGTTLPPVERALAGRVLAKLGDRREEVTTLDGMELCYVPPGAFRMGSDQRESEKPAHDLDLPYGYWMARYPVTVGQFRQYVEESGEEPGNRASLEGAANEPVARVSWREARRFCQWLTGRWRERGLLAEGWSVRLPSEAEWEKAARGGAEVPRTPHTQRADEGDAGVRPPGLELVRNRQPDRAFPWGEDFDQSRANTGETGVERTSAVGCFRTGASRYGCEDMAGNVWEWTRSLWGEDWQKPRFSYPYVPDDGRENPTAPDKTLRVLRGGAFDGGATRARCSARGRILPVLRDGFIGFRVSSSPFSSDL
jgi:formylglycine-generating enzyme required for sulfatase activity